MHSLSWVGLYVGLKHLHNTLLTIKITVRAETLKPVNCGDTFFDSRPKLQMSRDRGECCTLGSKTLKRIELSRYNFKKLIRACFVHMFSRLKKPALDPLDQKVLGLR